MPPADPSSFFPISVGFSAASTFSDLKVGFLGQMSPLLLVCLLIYDLLLTYLLETYQVSGIHPLKDGNPPKFSQRARLITANYQIV